MVFTVMDRKTTPHLFASTC